MNKAELIDFISIESKMSKSSAGAALDAFIKGIKGALRDGDQVALLGFGTFYIKDRAAREGRNPQTGEKIAIKAAKIPSFKPGKAFKEEMD